MDKNGSDDTRAVFGSQDELTPLVEMALRLDDAFTLVDQALAQSPQSEALRTALEQAPMRRICSLVRATALAAR